MPEPTRYSLGPELAFEQSPVRPRVTPFRKNVVMPRMWTRAGITLLSDALAGNRSALITPKGRSSIPYQTGKAWLSPDGGLLAFEDDDAGLVVLTAPSGAKLASLPRQVCAARWTSGQTLVALTKEDHAMAVTIRPQRWDRETAALTDIGKEHTALECALAADGKTALLRASDRKIVALDLASDRERSLWDPPGDRSVVLSPAADRACAVASLSSYGPLECVTSDGRRERLLDHFGGELKLDAGGKRAVACALARGERPRFWLVDFDSKTIRPFVGPETSSGVLSENGALYAESAGEDRLRIFDFDAGVLYESKAKLFAVDAIVGDGRRLLGVSETQSGSFVVDAHLVEVPTGAAPKQ